MEITNKYNITQKNIVFTSNQNITTQVTTNPITNDSFEKQEKCEPNTTFIQKIFSYLKPRSIEKKYDDIQPIDKWEVDYPSIIKNIELSRVNIPTDRIKLRDDVAKKFFGITSKNERLKLDLAISAKYIDGTYIFNDDFHLYEIAKFTNLNPKILYSVINLTKNNKEKISRIKNFADVLQHINSDNLDVFNYILKTKNPNGQPRYGHYSINHILDATKNYNKKAAITLLLSTNYKGKPRFNLEQITNILNYITEENIDALPYLLNAKKSNGHDKLEAFNWDILEKINKGNIDAVPYMLNSLCTIKGKTKHTLSFHEFEDLFVHINKNNIQTIPFLITELSNYKTTNNGILSLALIENILPNLTNGMEKVLPEIINIKDPIMKNLFLFRNCTDKHSIPDTAKAFLNPELKPIAKKLLKQLTHIVTQIKRHDTAEGIDELAEIIKNKQYQKERFYLNWCLDINCLPIYRNPKEIVALAKGLSDPKRNIIIKQLMKNRKSIPYFENFHNDNIVERVNNSMNIDDIKILGKVIDSTREHHILNLDQALKILARYKDCKINQIPIPSIVPKSLPSIDDWEKNLSYIDKYQTGNLSFESVPFVDRLEFKHYVIALEDKPLTEKTDYKFDIKELKKEINKYINQTITPTPVQKSSQINLFRYLLSNDIKQENQITSLDFEQYGKNGLPLEYSRKMFLNDLKNILSKTTEQEKNCILKKLQIETNADFTMYDGILNFADLKKNNPIEATIYDICEKFILKNTINTGDKNFDIPMNALIKGMPEFINIIGKQPHGGHNYSIDIHSLKVMKHCMLHSKYKKLNDIDKTKIKIAALLHDIAKKEDTKDKKHPETSALYARNILTKYQLPQCLKDDIYFIIENHHWLEDMNTHAKSLEELACMYRNPNDLNIMKIITAADLKSISNEVYDTYSPLLTSDKQNQIVALVDQIRQSGNILFTTKVIDKKKIPIEKYKNYTYKMINLTKYNNDDDLGEIGFYPGTKKDDLRFLIHTVADVESLKKVEDLSDISQNIVLSLSYVSPMQKGSYYNNGMGVSLDANIPDIINAYPQNQGSGYAKNKERMISLITRKEYFDYRNYLPKKLKGILHISDEEYRELYKQLSEKQHMTQISDNTLYKLSENKSIYGAKIKDGIKRAQDKLLCDNLHNEIIGAYLKVNAFVAKQNSISNIPIEYLEFVQQYDIPIILLGT